MATKDSFPTISPAGIDAVVVRFADRFDDAANRAALALRARVEEARWPQVVETASSLVSTLLRFDPLETRYEDLAERVEALLAEGQPHDATDAGRRLLVIPACFEPELAPQIDEAAEAAGFASAAAAIESICGAELRVLTIGFAPGQPYIGELPPDWNLPRQPDLTPRVPTGALGVAIRQMVLFAAPTQTGWRHLGQTAMRLFQPDSPRPFLMQPGDRLRFEPASAAELRRLKDDPGGGAREEPRA